MLRSVRLSQPVGQFRVVSTVIVVALVQGIEGLYLSAASSGCPMLWMILALSGMFPVCNDAIIASACPLEASCALWKRRRLSVECQCQMPNLSLAIRFPSVWNVSDMEAYVFPHLGQGSGGRPVAGKPHAGKYRELTLLRQRGGGGASSPLPSGSRPPPSCKEKVWIHTNK